MLEMMDQEVEQAMKLTPSLKRKNNRSTKKRLHPSITDQSYRYYEHQQFYRPSINLLTKRRTV